MSDESSFIRTICANPTDITPRLVFADWLEEHGDMEWSSFIRDPEPWKVKPRCKGVRYWRMRHIKNRLIGYPKSYKLSLVGKCARVPYDDNRITIYVRNGFIEQISVCQWAFVRLAKSLFENHPIQNVYLTRQNPSEYNPDGRIGWHPVRVANYWCGRDVIRPIYDRMIAAERIVTERFSFVDSDSAHKALSAACVAYGRELAGLADSGRPVAAVVDSHV